MDPKEKDPLKDSIEDRPFPGTPSISDDDETMDPARNDYIPNPDE